MEWTRICAASDGSDVSMAALECAAALSRRLSASLHVIHVRKGADVTAVPFAPPPPPVREDPEAEERLSRWVAERRAVLRDGVASVERRGDPATEILVYAEEANCDLIVVGTHSRRGIKRLVLGSVAEAVLRRSTRPVLVIPAAASGDPHDAK